MNSWLFFYFTNKQLVKICGILSSQNLIQYILIREFVANNLFRSF